MSIAFSGLQVRSHCMARLFRIIFADRPVDCPVLPKSCLRNSRHLVGAAADFNEWFGNRLQDHDREWISRGLGDGFVKPYVGFADRFVEKQISMGSASVHAKGRFLFRQNLPHGGPVSLGGFFRSQGHQAQLQNFAKLDQRICLLHEGRSGEVFRIDEGGG